MNQENDYGSDSESDEDFCPEKTGVDSVSEEDSDNCVEEEDIKDENSTKTRKKVALKKGKRSKTKQVDSDSEEEAGAEVAEETSGRSTRQNVGDADNKSKNEKDALESDEEKSRTDALWADFLSDVEPVAKKSPAVASTTSSCSVAKKAAATNGNMPHTNVKKEVVEVKKAELEVPKTIKVTEIVDFAGEEVRVEKTINADSIKENKAASTTTTKAGIGVRGSGLLSSFGGLKRPAAAGSSSGSVGGLGSILNQIGKKKKISVLEKTQLDWKSFKTDEGIDEQLQTFNKGKDGYLERQDFLQRTDVRQFEIEKNLRQSSRRNN